MNNEKTSNDTSIIPLGIVCSFMKEENSKELATFDEEFLTRGDKIVTKYFESLYVGDWIKDTISLIGSPCLCTFGSP